MPNMTRNSRRGSKKIKNDKNQKWQKLPKLTKPAKLRNTKSPIILDEIYFSIILKQYFNSTVIQAYIFIVHYDNIHWVKLNHFIKYLTHRNEDYTWFTDEQKILYHIEWNQTCVARISPTCIFLRVKNALSSLNFKTIFGLHCIW